MIERPEDSVATLERALPVVLLPVRLETRFIGSELRIRIYPDQIHVYQHDAELTHDEVAGAKRYWQAVWSNAGATEQAWRELLDRAKPERAAWLVDALRPTNLANRADAASAEFPELASVERRGMRPARARTHHRAARPTRANR